jgi:hypothetical protein
VPWFDLTAWYVYRKMRTVTYPTKGCTMDVQAPRKASIESPNPSKDEMHFNFSLIISIQVSTIIGAQLLNALDLEQSSSLGRTPVRWVWAEEATWHHSSMQVMGLGQVSSWTPSARCARRRLWGPDSVQSGIQRHASPREQPFKLLHGVRSRVNNHSLPRPICNYVHRIVL